jgi:hypothetical protein
VKAISVLDSEQFSGFSERGNERVVSVVRTLLRIFQMILVGFSKVNSVGFG